jgi:hypothetical protein
LGGAVGKPWASALLKGIASATARKNAYKRFIIISYQE